MRGAAAGFWASAEDLYRGDAGDHHGGDGDGEHARGDRGVRGEETETAIQLPSRVPGSGGPLGGHSCDALCDSDRPHRGEMAFWRSLLQHIHRHGCNVLHGLHHDPVRDQRGQVSLQIHSRAVKFNLAAELGKKWGRSASANWFTINSTWKNALKLTHTQLIWLKGMG